MRTAAAIITLLLTLSPESTVDSHLPSNSGLPQISLMPAVQATKITHKQGPKLFIGNPQFTQEMSINNTDKSGFKEAVKAAIQLDEVDLDTPKKVLDIEETRKLKPKEKVSSNRKRRRRGPRLTKE